MRCIFCKKSSGRSSSIQHIIPESLGNKELILRPGVVCDECNQYFAVKIEKPLLEMKYFQNVRFRNNIKSKKERNIPYKTLFPHKDGGWFEVNSVHRHIFDFISRMFLFRNQPSIEIA